MNDGTAKHDEKEKSTPRRMLTRGQVAKMLRRTETQVRRYDGSRLHPIEVRVAGKRRLRYDPDEVAVLRDQIARGDAERKRVREEASAGWTREEGDAAAAVFERLRAKKELVEIVIELRLPPEVVRRLREQYRRTFEDDDRERRAGEVARRERVESREHARSSAILAREERAARERRAARRMTSLGLGDTDRLRSRSQSDTQSETEKDR